LKVGENKLNPAVLVLRRFASVFVMAWNKMLHLNFLIQSKVFLFV